MSRSHLRTVAVVLTTALLGALLTAPAAATRPAPRITRAGLDPALVAGRGADVDFVEQEAENAYHTGEKIGPSREAYTLPAEASGRTAVRLDVDAVRRIHPDRARERVDPALQHSGRAGRRRDPGTARRDRERQAQADDDADVGVRLAVRHVSVLQRPERRPDPRVVEARAGPGRQAVPAEPLLRRAAAAARPARIRPAIGSGSPYRGTQPPPGTCWTWPTSSWSARRCSSRGSPCRCSGSVRTPADDATRRRPSSGRSRRPNGSAGRCSSRRAPTRSTGTSWSTR